MAKEEEQEDLKPVLAPTTPAKAEPGKNAASPSLALSDKKLQAYLRHSSSSPFPDYNRPSRQEAKTAHAILASIHGEKKRPSQIVASSSRAGCGDSPSVLDALVRTILSQNTSDTNSSRAKRSMDATYGSSDNWSAIVEGGQAKLQEAIKCGGLSAVKSKVILSILDQVQTKYGVYSLDHLFNASNDDAMQEMLSFQGVGPKTASCVLLFCMGRDSFAVDTHVHRITGLLGWRPAKASRDETHAHLEAKLPDEDKYALHVLFVQHGKVCAECKAGGRVKGGCELRKAFPGGRYNGQGEMDGVKEELGSEMKPMVDDDIKPEVDSKP
jgi:endonuclease III